MPPIVRNDSTLPPLRVAIRLDSLVVSAWIARLVKDLQSAAYVDLCAVLLSQSEFPSKLGNLQHRLYSKYLQWDEQRVPVQSDPLASVDIAAVLPGIPVLDANSPDTSVDILLWLSATHPSAPLAGAARFGIWFFSHGETSGTPPEAAYFWDLYKKNPVTPTTLLVQESGRAPRVLDRAVSSTEQGWSLRHNAAVPYARASLLVLRGLERLQQNPQAFQTLEGEPRLLSQPRGLPGNLQMLRFLGQNALRTATLRMRYSQHERHWFIAYRTDPSKFVTHTERFDPTGFRVLSAPKGHFYADPFVITWGGQDYLFFEDYSYRQQRACISVMRLDDKGPASEARPVLERPYHLSYPFVFVHDGALYMIPETLGAGRIELYRAVDAPGDVPQRWELAKVLMNGVQAVDTTLWIEDGIFYFFTNLAERGSTPNDDLFLFYATDLTGDWISHPANPICSDVRRSRSAGKLFRRYGRLIRPAQDCSVRYGYACQFNEIEVLSPDQYHERPVERIEPTWLPRLIGTHTINSNEKIEVIDAQISEPKNRVRA